MTRLTCLENFDDPNSLSPKRAVYEWGEQLCISSRRPCTDDSLKPQGFFSLRRIGLWRPVKVHFSVFSTGQVILFGIQCKLFDISEAAVTVGRNRLFFGAREFFIRKAAQTLISCTYWN